LCHAVLTPQKWKEHFGEAGIPRNMEPIRKAFNGYLSSDIDEREKIKKIIWGQFGIEPKGKDYKQ
jgi:hypothetical protein